MQIPSALQFRILASRIEQLRVIPYIIGPIDGSHIHVLALIIGGEELYCRIYFIR